MRDKFINAIGEREARMMLKTIILILIIIALGGCSSKKQIEPITETQSQNQCVSINLIKDVNWNPFYSGYYAPKCNSDSSYYENGAYVGKWYSDNCSKITVFNPNNASGNFSFYISQITTDTLIVISGRFGVTKFYK